jgi:hypothetical protein
MRLAFCAYIQELYITTPPPRHAPDATGGVDRLAPALVRGLLRRRRHGGLLFAALLGAIYQQQAVWIAGLAVFSLFCAQAGVGYYFSRERVLEVQVEVAKTGRDRVLTSTML